MIRQRFARLISPGFLLTAALLVGSVQLGFAYSLDAYNRYLSRSYEVSRAEWGKFTTDVWGLAPNVTAMVILFFVVGTFAAPEQQQNNRKQLQALARKKLGSAVLTQDELVFWNRVLEETEDA